MRNYFFCAICFLFFGCGNEQNMLSEAETKNDAVPKTVMAVFAHPDDELDVSPLLARLASQGHQVYLTIATNGNMGVRQHAQIPAGDSLAHVRERETECTCNTLGINPPVMLGLDDGKLSNWDALAALRRKLDSVFVIYKPDIVITWGAEGGSGHPDHRMVGAVVTELFQSAQSSFHIGKLFYTAIPTEHWKNEPPYQSEEQTGYHRIYKSVDKKYLPVRIWCSEAENRIAREAMRCNVSQYPPKELDDNELWMTHMNKDTVYLRPYTNAGYISDDIFK
ncbi:PIG-L family deacetylase [Agriterribacter sp.]|uniref:PIG-L deacetylase family protein n=1 Tax=Agriterribacter sp. TaxID=2821509 RepID=UPI002CF46529|nr:PIG-L family deacetylase [Agriterribacter sp.]HRP57394.1 PIG-L family deacetylase [Agriterribacter sp.]